MNTRKLRVVIEEINEYLSQSRELTNTYSKLLRSFICRTENSVHVLGQIYELLNDNPELREKFISVTKGFLLSKINMENISQRCLKNLRQIIKSEGEDTEPYRILSLLQEGIVSSRIIINCLINKFSPTSEEVEQMYDDLLLISMVSMQHTHKIIGGVIHSPNILQHLSNSFNTSKLRQIPEELTFLAILSILIEKTSIQSAVKCLKLYGSQIISIKSAINWFRTIGEYAAKCFERVASASEPFNVHPATLLSISKQYLPEPMLQWYMGEDFIAEFAKVPQISFTTPLQAVRHNDESAIIKMDQFFATPDLADMQANVMMQSIRGLASAVKKNTRAFPSETIINSLYGSSIQGMPNSEKILEVVFRRCRKTGGIMQTKFDRFISTQTHTDVVGYRASYKKQLNKAIVLRRIFLNDYSLKYEPEKLQAAKELISKIAEEEEGLQEFVDELFKSFENDGFVTEFVAIGLFYIAELVRILSLAVDPPKPSELASIVLTRSPPFSELHESPLENFDIPATKVFSAIGRLKKEGVEGHIGKTIGSILGSNEKFLFKVGTLEGIFSMHGEISPFELA